ncbi:MAG: DUF1836 domain-containing protein [Lachnospiraceae bacterium]|nr:DUF1836 domain-containing protein [Lachnospiraceae bacterium]
MTINTEDLLNSILASLDRIDYIKPEEVPDIELYMDQVTTFMDNKLRSSVRHPGDDKILTKTMINNYAKNDLLPPPVKKKYSREHVLVLIFIYYYKGILSITDIQSLLKPITDKYFHNGKDFNLERIYNEVFSLEKETVERMKEDIKVKYARSMETFEDAPEESVEFLRKFAFICELSYDVYVKKQIIEKMIDELNASAKKVQADNRKEKK